MNQEMQVFNHAEFGGVRVLGDSDNPLFCLSDVCRILAIGNPSDVKKRLDKGVVSIETLETAGGMQRMVFVNEDGLYDVILDSRKPSAKRFRKWLTGEVIPAIRKSGLYINPKAPIDPRFLRRIADELERKDNLIAQMKPKADYCEKILQSQGGMPVTIIAKEYGCSGLMFNELLRSFKIQYKVGKTWVLNQKYTGKGYTETKTIQLREGFSPTVQTLWTQHGRQFLYNELKKHGILPLVEREIPMTPLFEVSA